MKIEKKNPWSKDVERHHYPMLYGKVEVDVAVIGGGITGLLTAYLLAQKGVKVALVEKEKIIGGATEYTTAFITEIIDTNLADLIPTYGEERAEGILTSHRDALNLIDEAVLNEHIECEFERVPNYIYAASEGERKDLEQELLAGATLGVNIRKGKKSLGFKNEGYLEVSNQAKFHPLKFLLPIAAAIEREGGKIFENTEAQAIEDDSAKTVRTTQGEVHADWIIAATYSPFHEPASLFLKKAMYVTYMYELEANAELPEGIYEDLQNPYHYFRVDKKEGGERIILGGEDHRMDIHVDETKNFEALEAYAHERFGAHKLLRRWKGLILEPVDGLAFIGPEHDGDRVLHAFGFSGNGMTYAGIAAQIFSDHILGKQNQFADLYAASRMPGAGPLYHKGKDYIGELRGGALKNTFSYHSKK